MQRVAPGPVAMVATLDLAETSGSGRVGDLGVHEERLEELSAVVLIRVVVTARVRRTSNDAELREEQ